MKKTKQARELVLEVSFANKEEAERFLNPECVVGWNVAFEPIRRKGCAYPIGVSVYYTGGPK